MRQMQSGTISRGARVAACCLMLSVATASGTVFAAQGDPAGDANLQNMKPDIQACMQPGLAGEAAKKNFSMKYNIPISKVNEIIARSNSKDKDPGTLVIFACDMEIGSQIFRKLWEDRAKDVHWSCGSENKFCYQYSANCNHYVYNKDCALSKLGSCVSK